MADIKDYEAATGEKESQDRGFGKSGTDNADPVDGDGGKEVPDPTDKKPAPADEPNPNDKGFGDGGGGDDDSSGNGYDQDTDTDINGNDNDDTAIDNYEDNDVDLDTSADDSSVDDSSDPHYIDEDHFVNDVTDGTEVYDFGSLEIGLPSDQFGSGATSIGESTDPIESDEIDPSDFVNGADAEPFDDAIPELSLAPEDAEQATGEIVDDYFSQPEPEPEADLDDFDFLDDAPVG